MNETELSPPGMSSIYRLFESFVAMREKNERQHKLFEQTLNRTRDTLQEQFNTFAGQTQNAYQQLRKEFQGEKKIGVAMLNEMLDLGLDLDQIVKHQPTVPGTGPEAEGVRRWMEGIEVLHRKVQDALVRNGVHPYDAEIGSPYNPALHERVGSTRVDGFSGHHVAEQKERGYASAMPEFVLRRAKVVITE